MRYGSDRNYMTKRTIRFYGGAAIGEYPFWQSSKSIVDAFRRKSAFPIRNVSVEDEDGNVLWTEADQS